MIDELKKQKIPPGFLKFVKPSAPGGQKVVLKEPNT